MLAIRLKLASTLLGMVEQLAGSTMDRLMANPMIGVADLQVGLGAFFAAHGRDLDPLLHTIRLSGMGWKTAAKVIIGDWF